jgi:hypothetical protein
VILVEEKPDARHSHTGVASDRVWGEEQQERKRGAVALEGKEAARVAGLGRGGL